MKRFLIAVSLLLSLSSLKADNINNILNQVAQNNLSLRALQHEGEAQVLDEGNSLAGPSVEYSPFWQKGYNGVSESELIVKEDFEFPTKYAARNRKKALVRTETSCAYEAERRSVLLEAKILCLDVIRTNQIINVLEQRLRNSQALSTMFEERLRNGDTNILEVNKIKLDCLEVKTMLQETLNERTLLLQQLQQLNGGIALDIPDDRFPEQPVIADYESFARLAMAEDGTVLSAEALLNTARQDVRIANQEWLPNISAGFRRNTSMEEAAHGILVGISFPVLGNGRSVKAAKHRRESAQLQLEMARQEAEARLQTLWTQYQSLQQVLDHSDVQLLNETLTLLQKALEQGEISALTYYTEVSNIHEKLQRHIDVHCQSEKLLAQLHKNSL